MANPWLAHVKQVKAKNSGLSFKQVLKLAAKSYKKISPAKKPAGKTRKARKSKKSPKRRKSAKRRKSNKKK
jgi:hypothetical protein